MATVDFQKIDLLVLDVDGVMTDGKIILTPSGEEIKEFHVRDGSGIRHWRRAGKKLAIITGRGSDAVRRRAEELDADAVRLKAKDKLQAYQEVLTALGISADRTAVVGDDLMDLPLMARCALPVAVADAVEEVRRAAAYVTVARGGRGAVREVVELILRKALLWDAVIARYLGADRT